MLFYFYFFFYFTYFKHQLGCVLYVEIRHDLLTFECLKYIYIYIYDGEEPLHVHVRSAWSYRLLPPFLTRS